MKRSDALAVLSRDHQHGLAVALGLRRTTLETAAAARAEFISFWKEEGLRHFRLEEEILLPAFARHGSADHEAVVRVLVEHVELRRHAADMTLVDTPAPKDLRSLGELLHSHIRHEERTLFPLIEQALPAAELSELVLSLDQAQSGR